MAAGFEEQHHTFWEHVSVLRTYLLIGVSVFVAVAIGVFTWGSEVLASYLLAPLHGQSLFFLSPMGPFLFKLRLALYAAFVVVFPLWFILVFLFVAPALSRRRKVALTIFALVSGLCGVGALVGSYLYVVPLTLEVLRGFVVPHTELLLTAESYVSFFILETTLFFVVAQIPVVIVALAYLRLLDPHTLARQRRVLVVVLVGVLAVLTPTTDLLTLCIVVLPALLLSELGIGIARMVYTNRV